MNYKPIRSVAIYLAPFMCMLVQSISVNAQTDGQKRPQRIDDVNFSARNLVEQAVFSPDGIALAYVVSRPRTSLPGWMQSTLTDGKTRYDLWVQDAPGTKAHDLMKGASDGSGAWEPRWSPDGQRLAFLASRGKNITLWVWERAADTVRQVSKQGVIPLEQSGMSFTWLDASRILCTVPVDGETVSLENVRGEAVSQATAAWERARRGEVSVSVVSSIEFQYPKRSLFVIDVATGEGRRIAATLQRHPFYPDWWLSPDARSLAVVSPMPAPYNTASSLKMGFPHNIELRNVSGEPIKLAQPLPENVHTQNIHWSPDGKELAFFANGTGPVNPVLLYGVAAAEVMPASEKKVTSLDNPAKLYRVNIEKGTITQVDTGGMDLGQLGSPDFTWTASGELVFQAPRRRYGSPSSPPASRGAPWGWSSSNAVPASPRATTETWVLSRDGNLRSLLKNGSKQIGKLVPLDGGSAFATVIDGDVMMIDPATGTAHNLTENFTPKVLSISADSEKAITASLLMGADGTKNGDVGRASNANYFLLDLKTLNTKKLPDLPTGGRLYGFSSESQSALYFSIENGMFLWRSTGGGQTDALVEANTYLKDLQKPEAKIIDYTSLNGEKLKASMFFPIDYKPGKKYPMVVDVRIGSMVAGPTNQSSVTYNELGFVYIFPSIPQNIPGMNDRTGGEEGDTCLSALNGVMPAVQKAIDMGYADPDRLFVEGSSRGGYSTMCIVGLTTRFKAATEIVGYGEIATMPQGGLTRRFLDRYSENPSNLVSSGGSWPKGYRPSDLPWWRDGDRNRRSSPMSYVDRIQTPLMLVHGEMDSTVDPSQGFDFFNALVSMRKPAQLLMYWGEGHAFANPANERDRFMRQTAWYDQWGDIARDADGKMIFERDQVKGRNGAPPLKPEDYAKFDFFQPSPARQQNQATATPKAN